MDGERGHMPGKEELPILRLDAPGPLSLPLFYLLLLLYPCKPLLLVLVFLSSSPRVPSSLAPGLSLPSVRVHVRRRVAELCQRACEGGAPTERVWVQGRSSPRLRATTESTHVLWMRTAPPPPPPPLKGPAPPILVAFDLGAVAPRAGCASRAPSVRGN